MSEQVDCVVAGHICLDVTPEMFSARGTVAEIFRPGKLIQVGPSTVSTGGPVSNTGLSLRRLGVSVKLMGKCGDDMFGQALIEAIRAEAPGAEGGMHIAPGEDTSYTIVVCPPGIDRIFLHCPGANDTFSAADVDLEAAAEAKLFHFGYPPLMAHTYADGGAELVKIFSGAKAAGPTTSLDMANPDPAGPAGSVDWTAILDNVLPHVDIFTPSVEELTFMLRRPTFDELVAGAGDGELLKEIDGRLLSELGERCIAAGTAVVLLKCGYLGLYLRTAGRGRLEKLGRAKCGDIENWTNRELFEPSYAVDRIVSANGAGDCAIAGFLASFLRGCDVETVLRYACTTGAQNLRALDAVSGIAGWEQTTRQVESRPAKVEVDIPLERWRYDDGEDHYVGPSDRRL